MADPTYWITGTEVLAAAADRVGRDLADRAADVAAVADNSLRQAHGAIFTILANKGYSKPVIDAWDYRKDYVRRMALFWFFVDLSIDGFDQERLKPYDVRPELKDKEFGLIVNGVPVKPDQGDSGADGTDTDGDGVADGFGNNAFFVGRFTERDWTTKRTTRF